MKKVTKSERAEPKDEAVHVGQFLLFDPSSPCAPIVIDEDFHLSIAQAEQYRRDLDEALRLAYLDALGRMKRRLLDTNNQNGLGYVPHEESSNFGSDVLAREA